MSDPSKPIVLDPNKTGGAPDFLIRDPHAFRQIDPTEPLENTQYEQFANYMAAGGLTAVDAYEKAGFARSKSGASKLKEKPDVHARIVHLQKELVATLQEEARAVITAVGYTRDDAMAEAHTAYELASRILDPKAMIAAVQLKSLLAGLVSTQQQREPATIDELPLGTVKLVVAEMRRLKERNGNRPTELHGGSGSGPRLGGGSS